MTVLTLRDVSKFFGVNTANFAEHIKETIIKAIIIIIIIMGISDN